MDYKVGLSPKAHDDLREALRFITAQGGSPETALQLGNEPLDAALSLALLPRRGSPVWRRGCANSCIATGSFFIR
jgi:plasmid stabilization system protein ParE